MYRLLCCLAQRRRGIPQRGADAASTVASSSGHPAAAVGPRHQRARPGRTRRRRRAAQHPRRRQQRQDVAALDPRPLQGAPPPSHHMRTPAPRLPCLSTQSVGSPGAPLPGPPGSEAAVLLRVHRCDAAARSPGTSVSPHHSVMHTQVHPYGGVSLGLAMRVASRVWSECRIQWQNEVVSHTTWPTRSMDLADPG